MAKRIYVDPVFVPDEINIKPGDIVEITLKALVLIEEKISDKDNKYFYDFYFASMNKEDNPAKIRKIKR